MELPDDIRKATQFLFDSLPLDRAMPELVVTRTQESALLRAAEEAAGHEAVRRNPGLVAGLWLYVDDLDRSHVVSQQMPGPTGAYWHSIMHRREGDFGNSHYWMRHAGKHPAIEAMGDHDPDGFIDDVARQHQQNPTPLLAVQRLEWSALFQWCARNG